MAKVKKKLCKLIQNKGICISVYLQMIGDFTLEVHSYNIIFITYFAHFFIRHKNVSGSKVSVYETFGRQIAHS